MMITEFAKNRLKLLPIWAQHHLGPDNNPYLDKIITIKNGVFLFLLQKCAEIPIFIVALEHQPKVAKKGPKKNDNCSHLAKHKLIKETFCCNPLLTKNVCFSLSFLKAKTLMLDKKHKLRSGNKEQGWEKGIWKIKQDRKPKKRTDWWKKPCNRICWCCSFHETKATRKQKKTKRRNQKKAKKKDEKEGRKKTTRERERGRERESEKGGGQKRLRRKEGGHWKITKNDPFLGEKEGFSMRSKGRTEKKKTQTGGFGAKWGGPSGQKNKRKQRNKLKNNKNNNKKIKKNKKQENNKNTKNELFSYQSK